MSTAVAKNLMAEMKLLGMLPAFEKLLTEATRDQISYTEFANALLQAECDYPGGHPNSSSCGHLKIPHP